LVAMRGQPRVFLALSPAAVVVTGVGQLSAPPVISFNVRWVGLHKGATTGSSGVGGVGGFWNITRGEEEIYADGRGQGGKGARCQS